MKEPKQNVSLHQYTTLHIGGVADYVWEVESVEEVRAACRFAKQTGTPPGNTPLILGGGSNVLISDEGYRGVVIRNCIQGRTYHDVSDDVVHLTVGAGELLDDVVADTVARGLWGLENLSSIPGTVGATPVQNVGAYGVEVADSIVSVQAVHRDSGEEKLFSQTECAFAYRDSFFKTPDGRLWIITAVTFALSRTPQPQIAYADLAPLRECTTLTPADIRTQIQQVRAAKFPDWTVVGTAGSFFKNPIISSSAFAKLVQQYPDIPSFVQSDGRVKVPLGYILDKVCQLKGYREGNVGLYENQALVLVAYDGATATEVKTFVKKIEAYVFEKTNIQIECEVQFI